MAQWNGHLCEKLEGLKKEGGGGRAGKLLLVTSLSKEQALIQIIVKFKKMKT